MCVPFIELSSLTIQILNHSTEGRAAQAELAQEAAQKKGIKERKSTSRRHTPVLARVRFRFRVGFTPKAAIRALNYVVRIGPPFFWCSHFHHSSFCRTSRRRICTKKCYPSSAAGKKIYAASRIVKKASVTQASQVVSHPSTD